MRRCLGAGLVEGQRLTVDGTVVAANASPRRGAKPEQLEEVAKVSRTVREYLAEVAQENPVLEHEENPPADNSVAARCISTTDPDACWAGKRGLAVPSYYDHYLIDNASCIILRVALRRVRLRRLWNVAKQFYLAATAQNLKRLVKFLAQREPSPVRCAT